MTIRVTMGSTTESTDIKPAVTSSAKLTTGSPVPAVAAVTAGRTSTDLTVWTLPATSSPQIIRRTGLTFVAEPALAAKRTAPAVGRMKVCTASLTWSTAGILSATASIRQSTVSKPMVHQLVRASHGEVRSMRLVMSSAWIWRMTILTMRSTSMLNRSA